MVRLLSFYLVELINLLPTCTDNSGMSPKKSPSVVVLGSFKILLTFRLYPNINKKIPYLSSSFYFQNQYISKST